MTSQMLHEPGADDSRWTVEALQPNLEALLLLAEEPLPTVLLAQAVRAPEPLVDEALRSLAQWYDQTGRGFQLRNVGGGWRYATRQAQADLISRWVVEGRQSRLSQASLETLAVIAYLQPVSRSRVSAVRGVNVDGVVRKLLDRELVVEDGNDDQTGAATLATTDYFLARLGLESLDDLPGLAPYLPNATELEAELAAVAAETVADEDSPNQASNGDDGSLAVDRPVKEETQ